MVLNYLYSGFYIRLKNLGIMICFCFFWEWGQIENTFWDFPTFKDRFPSGKWNRRNWSGITGYAKTQIGTSGQQNIFNVKFKVCFRLLTASGNLISQFFFVFLSLIYDFVLLSRWTMETFKWLENVVKLSLCNPYMTESHRVDRGILSHISNINFQFWAVLGSRSCRGKKIQTVISMLLLRTCFFMF